MMLSRLYGLILGLTFMVPCSSANICKPDRLKNNRDGIELIIDNIRSTRGVIRLGIYTSEAQYPDNPKITLTFPKDSLNQGQLKVFIPVKDNGSYAIAVLDDEINNNKMDYRLGLFPREGFGFSNNPKIRGLKEPSFSEKSFLFTGGIKTITINMVYIL
jgi:uncharacterized protein (DUF2141 family)